MMGRGAMGCRAHGLSVRMIVLFPDELAPVFKAVFARLARFQKMTDQQDVLFRRQIIVFHFFKEPADRASYDALAVR